MSQIQLTEADLQRLTPEEQKQFFPGTLSATDQVIRANQLVDSNIIFAALHKAKWLLSKNKIPPQSYSEDQLKKCSPRQLDSFFQFWECPPILQNVNGIIQILRFSGYLAPSQFQDLFTYQYTISSDPVTSYIDGKLLKPIDNLPVGFQFDLLNVSVNLWMWKGEHDEEVQLYL